MPGQSIAKCLCLFLPFFCGEKVKEYSGLQHCVVSGVQQSESLTCVHVYPLFNKTLFPYGLLEDVESPVLWSSLVTCFRNSGV